MNTNSKRIWSNKDIIVNLADVGHIEKRDESHDSADGTIKKGDLSGILVVMKHTGWDMEVDTWDGGVWISAKNDQALQFINEYCAYVETDR